MKKILLIFLLLSMFFYSCKETELVEEGYIIERNDLYTSVGFDWFRERHNAYQPNSVAIEQIKNSFRPNHKFIVFVKPTCSCQGTQFDFPSLIKTFDEANIPAENYEIWAVAKEHYKHNHMDIIDLKKLPACYLVVDGVPVFSILDTFYEQTDAGIGVNLEDVVAESLGN